MAFQVPGVWLKETEQRFGSEGLVPIVAVPTMLCANVNSLSLSEPQSLLYTRENATILFGFGGWPSESPTLHKYLSLFFYSSPLLPPESSEFLICWGWRYKDQPGSCWDLLEKCPWVTGSGCDQYLRFSVIKENNRKERTRRKKGRICSGSSCLFKPAVCQAPCWALGTQANKTLIHSLNKQLLKDSNEDARPWGASGWREGQVSK